MSLCLSASTFALAWKTHSLGGWLLAPLDSTPSFSNISWDDFCYIPRINAASTGDFFSDPWNNHNPAWRGWGSFGLLPPLVAGAFMRLTQDYFVGVSAWTAVNFLLLSWLFYRLFRGGPFHFDRSLGISFTFILLSAPWLATQSLGYHGDVPNIALFGVVRHALTRIECGLLTYLPYGLFLFSYWRWLSAPTLKRSLLTGACAGLLGYVYFYHYSFAFLLLAARGAYYLVQRRTRDFVFAVTAAGSGLLVMVPSLINAAVFEHAFAENLYHQRLDYTAGRIPSLDEYAWLCALLVPVLGGIVYAVAAPKSKLKLLLLGELAVMSLAYFAILHLRVLFGFMQAYDHFWRYSLGIPATLWTCAIVADGVQSYVKHRSRPARWIRTMAMVLPAFILIRSAIFTQSNVARERAVWAPWSDTLPEKQNRLIAQMNVIEGFLAPGDGFIAADTVLNYHIMVNMKARPFVAFGCSPLSIEDLTERALIGHYLTGSDTHRFPDSDRSLSGYLCETDPHLYLYINLFETYLREPDSRRPFERIYREWTPAGVDWESWRSALSNVRAIVVNSDRAQVSRRRLSSLFTVEREAEVQGITVFLVRPIR